MSIDFKFKPFLPRFSYCPSPSINLNEKQAQSISIYSDLLDSGFFTFTPNPCLCRNKQDVLIGQRDRYGFPLKTVLCRNCCLMRSDAEAPIDFLCEVAHLRAHVFGLDVASHGDCEYCSGGSKHKEWIKTADGLLKHFNNE